MTSQKTLDGIAVGAPDYETGYELLRALKPVEDWKKQLLLMVFKPDDADVRVVWTKGYSNKVRWEVDRRIKNQGYAVQHEEVEV